MKEMLLIRNKGTEACRELQAQDPNRVTYEKRKAQEDAAKYRQIVAENRRRLGLEVSNV